MSKERQVKILERQINDLALGINDLKNNDGEYYSIKQLEKSREKIEEKSEETVKPLVIQTQQRKLDLDQLHSSAGIVISLDDGKVIFQFQQDENNRH